MLVVDYVHMSTQYFGTNSQVGSLPSIGWFHYHRRHYRGNGYKCCEIAGAPPDYPERFPGSHGSSKSYGSAVRLAKKYYPLRSPLCFNLVEKCTKAKSRAGFSRAYLDRKHLSPHNAKTALSKPKSLQNSDHISVASRCCNRLACRRLQGNYQSTERHRDIALEG
jgi:hypothetical protein